MCKYLNSKLYEHLRQKWIKPVKRISLGIIFSYQKHKEQKIMSIDRRVLDWKTKNMDFPTRQLSETLRHQLWEVVLSYIFVEII